jgi:hypothetical protein
MTNRWVILSVSIVFSLSLIWLGRQLRKIANRTDSFETFLPQNLPEKKILLPPGAAMANLEIGGRKVIGILPSQKGQGSRPARIALSNKVSSHWKEDLEKTLTTLGGPTLKDIKISKLDSFVWSVSGQALNVESVIITLENTRGEISKFNALIDSQNGKIIQTWNQPTVDPSSPRDNPGVRIDPRYFNN